MNSPRIQKLATQIARHIKINTPRIEKCSAGLTESEFKQRPNPQSNSIGNLLLHLCGNIALFALLSLFACNSPEARLERLKHDFWEKFAQHDFFEIKLKNEVLHLPLPPASAPSEQVKSLAERLQKEANSIDSEQLSIESQKQLAQLRTALDDCVAHAGGAFFDPSRCVVLKHLQQFTGHPELSLLLEKIPAYYAQIEMRWQRPDARFVSKAVAESQITLDLLDGLRENSGREIVAQSGAARTSVKDFIGLCQSALLR